MLLKGYVKYKTEDVESYYRNRWWLGLTIGDLLDKAADLYPGKEALVEGSMRFTYAQLREQTNRLAIGFMKLGIKYGDPVMLQFPNWHEFPSVFFALQKIGAITVLLLPRHSRAEIDSLCSSTKAVAWIVPEKYRDIEYLDAVNDVKVKNPQLKHVILLRAKKSEQFVSLNNLMHEAVLSEVNIRELIHRKPDPGEVAVILPSGGTTGMPKAVPRTHNDFICYTEYKARALELNSFDRTLVFTPLGHGMSLNCGITPTIFAYGKLVILDTTRPEDFCRTVQKERITYSPIVPTLLRRIIDFERLKDYDLSSLIRFNVGGASSTPDLIERVQKEIGCKYCNSFGMVEGLCCQIRLNDDKELVMSGSVGRPLNPYDTIRVVDSDLKPLPLNTEGELVGKGPTIFTGYLNFPEENSRAFTPDGFFRTGDLAIIDSNGNVKITGRIKDIIIRGGENIGADAVEEIVSGHPDIKEVSVVSVPDKDLGEKVCACIVVHPGRKSPTLEDIAKFLKEKGAGKLLIPERIEYFDEIPITSVNKPDKHMLREEVKKRAGIS
ncbi:(2,3-dihydroxybenzoyl)adenylate synthase [Chloroflexota bacterium]